MIYLDNSATAPIDEEVRDAMLPYLNEEFGNPSSKYYCKATHAKNAVEEAREKVAKLLGANPDEIIFTAGATESTNFIIKGYLDYRKFYGDGKNHVITSLVEHKATLNTMPFSCYISTCKFTDNLKHIHSTHCEYSIPNICVVCTGGENITNLFSIKQEKFK